MDEFFISKITVIISAIPIVVALFRYSYLNKALLLFLAYKSLSLVVNLLEHLFIWYVTKYYEFVKDDLEYFNIESTSFMGVFFNIIVFIFIGRFYGLLLGKSYTGKIVLWISYLLLTIVIVNYLFIEGYNAYGKFNHAADAIFMFGSASYYLYHLYKSNLSLPMSRNPYFWISVGIILPNLIGIFLFLVGDSLYKEDYFFFTALTSFKNLFLIISHLLAAIGFYQAPFVRFITLPDEKNT